MKKSGRKIYNKEHSSFLENKFNSGLGILAARYGIDCVYICNSSLPDLGLCSLYLALDIRDDVEKFDKSFDRAIFEIDGSIVEDAQVNSVILTPKEVDAVARNHGIKLKIDYSKLFYEAIAVKDPSKSCLESLI